MVSTYEKEGNNKNERCDERKANTALLGEISEPNIGIL